MTLPSGIGGDFLVYLAFEARAVPDSSVASGAIMSYAVNATLFAVNHITVNTGTAVYSGLHASASQEWRHTGIRGGATIEARYAGGRTPVARAASGRGRSPLAPFASADAANQPIEVGSFP